ncbi:MAG TPA: acylphosphatase [Deltaproteobacteria bacterium]|nr:acylphosphatase [Deltaproteobacteria bacterium]HOM29059.1 acylphosphatase [Deltaproteobacteria bacterium]HPP80800.1 acylphosphatase [Deltaproteobacteria bacterium]
MKAFRLTIRGRVQGVWYRATARETAQGLGIRGWVRNAEDGSVEAHIQGDDESLERMIRWCRTGPPGARVEEVLVEEAEPVDEYRSFSIRYY